MAKEIIPMPEEVVFEPGVWNEYNKGQTGSFQFPFGSPTSGTAKVYWAWGINNNHVITAKARVYVKPTKNAEICGSLIKFAVYEGNSSDDWPGWTQEVSQASGRVKKGTFSLVSEDKCNTISIDPKKNFMITIKVLCELGQSNGVGWEEAYKAGERYLGPFNSSPPAHFPIILTQSEPDKVLGMNDTCLIKWEPLDHTASSLHVVLRDSMGTELANKDYLVGGSTQFSYNLSSGTQHRGATLTAYLNITPTSDYSNIGEKTIILGRINTLPSRPQVQQTGILVDGTHNVTFTLADAYDPDGQKTNYQYTLSSALSPQWNSCGQTITFTLANGDSQGKIQLPSDINGIQVIRFRSFDGLEGSDEVSYQFNVQQAPRINIPVYSFWPKEGTLAKECNISFQLAEDIVNPEILVQVSRGSNSEDWRRITNYQYEGYDQIKLIKIKIANIPDDIIPRGEYFRIRLMVRNNSGYSTPTEPSSAKQKSFLPRAIVIDSIVNDGTNSMAKDNFFSEKVKINASLPASQNGYASIQKIVLLVKRSNGEVLKFPDFWGKQSNGNLLLNISKETPSLDKILPNETITFGFSVRDILDQESTWFYNTFTKANNLSKEKILISINPTSFKPLSSIQPMEIVHTTPQSTGSNGFNIQYIIARPSDEFNTIDSDQYVLTSYDYTKDDSQPGSTKIRIEGSKINSVLNSIFNKQADRIKAHEKTRFIFKAEDGFGKIIEVTAFFQSDYGESPYFSESLFSLSHDYDTSLGKNLLQVKKSAVLIPTYQASSTENLDIRMANYQEKILLKFPRAIDKNNDVVKYHIYVSRDNFFGMSTATTKDTATFDAVPWRIILASELDSLNQSFNEPNYYYYYLTVPRTFKNECCWFKIEAVDSGGKHSKNVAYSDTFIINCRSVDPVYSLSGLKIQQQGNQVLLDASLRILDLGGSATIDGWDPAFYNKYKNYDRIFSNNGVPYQGKFKIIFSIDTNYNFDPGDPYLKEKTITGEVAEGRTLLEVLNSQKIKITFSGMPEQDAKFYIKTQLIFSMGINSNETDPFFQGLSFIEGTPNIVTYLGDAPTVSHRPHCVGINSNNFKEDELFIIQSYGAKDKIRFMSTIPNKTGEMEISFNLKTGEISGAIISGGTWE